MKRHKLVAIVATAFLVMTAAAVGILSQTSAYAATTQQSFLTFYGWWDNTPPGGAISFPQIHKTAGGTGTFADPITFAGGTSAVRAGTKLWVPRVHKYFIMEDECPECQADFTGHGPNGGPGLWHFDLWSGGQGGDATKAIDCEDALTNYNADGTPNLEPVVIDPPANEPADATPLFDVRTGQCYAGALPHSSTGQFKNTSAGTCLTDPGNSTTAGTALTLTPCGSGPEQAFYFHGAFMTINNLCAAGKTGNVTLQKCDAGPTEQWSVNPNGTISDIQTGRKCFAASGTNVIAGSCSSAASQWTFPPVLVSGDFYLATTSRSGSVPPGGSTTVGVNTQGAGPPASIVLSASGLPAGATATFAPATVAAPNTATMTIQTAASTPPGSYSVTVTGTAAPFTHSVTYTLVVGTAQTNDFSLATSPTAGTVAAGSSITTSVSAAVVSGTPGTVALSASGAPAGVTVTFNPTSITPGGQPATMTVAAASSAAAGPATIVVSGTSGLLTHTAGLALTVTAPGGGGNLLSQGKPATASSTKSDTLSPAMAVDGNATTKWQSRKTSATAWLQVDLGATATISEVKLLWASGFATQYQIQISTDGKTWTTVNTTTNSDGATDDLTVSGSGRYVRMNATTRADPASGYSLFEFQVYGTAT